MFDVAGAKAAGYSDAEIQQFLMSMPETTEARKAGYSDAEILQHFGLKVAFQKPTGSLTAGRAAEVAGGAVAPIAAAAGLGGLVGGPAGAALAAGGLGAADLATSLYNLAAPKIGTSQVRTPSEIARGYLTPESFRPRTESEELLAAAAEGGAGALTGAGAANVLARRAAPGVMRNVMATMGERPLVQAGAGAGAAAAPVRAEQLGVQDPRALVGLGLAGGLIGARGAAGLQRGAEATLAAGERGVLGLAGKPPTTEGLKERATQSFERAKSLGVEYKPETYSAFVDDLAKTLPGYYPQFPEFANINVAFDTLRQQTDLPLTIDRLHQARQMLGDLRQSDDKKIRRLAGIMTDKLDDFVTDSKNAIGADAGEAADALMSGIKDYKMMSKSAEIERLIERAATTEGWRKGRHAESLESQFGSLARNENRMRRFTDDEKAMIRRIAEGKEGSSLANFASRFAPTGSPTTLGLQAVVGGYGYGSDDPYALYGAGASALLGAGGRAVRNVLARRAAANTAAMMRGAPTAVPFDVNARSLAAPILSQSLNAMAR
jgi:hypothetical protein